MEGTPRGRVALLTTDQVEDVEFFYPYYRFFEAGYTVDVITPDGKGVEGYRGTKLQESIPLAGVHADGYDALYVPGGNAPVGLKDNEEAIALLREFAAQGKVIGAVCDGPLLLARAGLAESHDMTGYWQVEDDIAEGGGRYVDAPVVVDGEVFTARRPGDLPREMAQIIERLSERASW
jgi:protease I